VLVILDFNNLWKGIKDNVSELNEKVWNYVWEKSVAQDYMDGQKVGAASLNLDYSLNSGSVMKYYQEHGLELVKTLDDTDKANFKLLLEQGKDMKFREFQTLLDNSFIGSPERAKLIWDNEQHTASVNGTNDYVQNYAKETDAKIITKVWHRGNSIVPREAHLIEGESRPLNEAFSNGLMIPEGIGCKCWLEYIDEST
jgi:hypothetical protein